MTVKVYHVGASHFGLLSSALATGSVAGALMAARRDRPRFTLLVFGVFSVLYLGESLKWNHMVAFLFLCGAAFFSFTKWS